MILRVYKFTNFVHRASFGNPPEVWTVKRMATSLLQGGFLNCLGALSPSPDLIGLGPFERREEWLSHLRQLLITTIVLVRVLFPWKSKDYVFDTSIFQGVLFGSKGWCMGTPYHPWPAPFGRWRYVLNDFFSIETIVFASVYCTNTSRRPSL